MPRVKGLKRMLVGCSTLLLLVCAGCGGNIANSLASNAASSAASKVSSAHGMWTWNGTGIAANSSKVTTLRDVSVTKSIDNVYISALPSADGSSDQAVSSLIGVLHGSSIRVEALIGSTTADEPGAPRDALVALVQSVVAFNQRNPQTQFDGVHLDIEPQQRPEYATGIGYLPNLIDTYRAANAVAAPAGLAVDADIAKGVLAASLDQRSALLTSIPRLTLMFYQVGTLASSQSTEQAAAVLDSGAVDALQELYDGVSGESVATLAIGLRTADFSVDTMPQMFASLDSAGKTNPHYSGWSWQAYSDILTQQQ